MVPLKSEGFGYILDLDLINTAAAVSVVHRAELAFYKEKCHIIPYPFMAYLN